MAWVWQVGWLEKALRLEFRWHMGIGSSMLMIPFIHLLLTTVWRMEGLMRNGWDGKGVGMGYEHEV